MGFGDWQRSALALGIGSFSPPVTHHADVSQGERQACQLSEYVRNPLTE